MSVTGMLLLCRRPDSCAASSQTKQPYPLHSGQGRVLRAGDDCHDAHPVCSTLCATPDLEKEGTLVRGICWNLSRSETTAHSHESRDARLARVTVEIPEEYEKISRCHSREQNILRTSRRSRMRMVFASSMWYFSGWLSRVLPAAAVTYLCESRN